MKPLLVWLLLCSPALAQIELTAQSRLSVVGLTEAVTVGDRTLVGMDSKPMLVPVAIVKLRTAIPGVQVFAVQDMTETDLHKIPGSETEYMLVGSGEYLVIACANSGRASIKVTVGQGPRPPPVPETLPIAGEGFRVLIVCESSTLSQLPEKQKQIMYADEIRQYLNAKAAVVGDSREWRLLDPDVPMTNASKIWQDAMARPRHMLPWIAISNGKIGFEGPLPATIADTMALLRKYGGQ